MVKHVESADEFLALKKASKPVSVSLLIISFFPQRSNKVVLCLKLSLILSLSLLCDDFCACALSLVLLRSTRHEEYHPFALSPLTNSSLFSKHFEHFDLIFPKVIGGLHGNLVRPVQSDRPVLRRARPKVPRRGIRESRRGRIGRRRGLVRDFSDADVSVVQQRGHGDGDVRRG